MDEVLSNSIIYSLDELKKLVVSKADSELLHAIKRFMHKITADTLPGELFRIYPKNINFAYQDFREFLKSSEFNEYNIEVSNYGRIKINGKIIKQTEEKEGWFYIKTDKIYYPVWRFVAEVWCEFYFEDTIGWQVHHISNDGNDNTPNNLVWIKDSSHNYIPKRVTDKIKSIICKNKIKEKTDDINRIIENINAPYNTYAEFYEFVCSIILGDDTLAKKLYDLTSFDMHEKIRFDEWGLLNYIDAFIENIISTNENYGDLLDKAEDEKVINKLKEQFDIFLKEIKLMKQTDSEKRDEHEKTQNHQ